jgi:hypothetical protein
MANDHYISRFQTEPWEVGQRRLISYDFSTGRFGDHSSETLFAREGLHSDEAGKILGALVESPAGAHRAGIVRGGPFGNPSNDWKLYRALVALIWLQISRDPRSRIDIPADNPFTLDGLVAQREKLLDLMGQMSFERYPLIGVALPASSAPLFFTDIAYFPIPMIATPPLLAVPLTPRHLIATPEKDFPQEGLKQWLADPLALSVFSLGFGGVQRVVVPPEYIESKNADPVRFQRMLHAQRVNAEKIFNLVGEGNRRVGFRSFKTDNPGEGGAAE